MLLSSLLPLAALIATVDARPQSLSNARVMAPRVQGGKVLKQATRAQLIKPKPKWRRGPAPSATPPPSTVNGFKQYYSGSGKTLATNNPGNADAATHASQSTNYGGTNQPNVIASSCSSFANYYSYSSFQFYYDTSTDVWVCTIYYDENTDTSYFSVDNSNANPVYGYNINT